MTKWMWIVAAPMLIAGCATGDEPKTGKAAEVPIFQTAGMRTAIEGILNFGSTVFETNPSTLLQALDFHTYEFDGHAGGTVTITATATPGRCGSPDTVLDLFTADDFDAGGTQLIENDDDGLPCAFDSRITNFRLPVDGTYVIMVRSFRQAGSPNDQNGHYRLTLACTNGACNLAGSPNAATVRVNQADIDAGRLTAQQLFDLGDFTFEHVFQTSEGLGNALAGAPGNGTARPAFRNIPNNVHFAAFGSPESHSCVDCHNIGGDDGAGDLNHNIFQIGDGINRASGVPRNPPTVLGNGLRQVVGEEMTKDIQAQRNTGLTNAKNTGVNQTVSLSSKGISFGSIVAHPDQTIDFTNLKGVDTDLVIKPFGWKGREATLRRFVEGGFRVHFGMQSDVQVKANCPVNGQPSPNINLLGTANCPDPDGDGVSSEITEGQLSAMATYMGLREIPVRVPAISAAAQSRASSGESLFKSVGCTSCHTQNMKINVPVHTEKADAAPNGTGGAGITINLRVENHDPKPPVAADGSMTIEVFSDFKRHDVGAALADVKDFNQIKANQFITPPLWGIAVSPPYLHDGRAPTLLDAILAHAGDAQTVRNNFGALTADQQSQIVEFLLTLGRQENVDAAAAGVDLSNFIMQEIRPQNANVSVVTTIAFPTGTTVPHGGRVVIARNATLAQFQSFYGRTLDTNTRFFTGGNVFPTVISGSQYGIFDSNGDGTTLNVGVDGFTFPATGGQILQRKDCGVIATLSGSWNFLTATPSTANPGIVPVSDGVDRFCITEVADSPTNSNFDFIELFVDQINIH